MAFNKLDIKLVSLLVTSHHKGHSTSSEYLNECHILGNLPNEKCYGYLTLCNYPRIRKTMLALSQLQLRFRLGPNHYWLPRTACFSSVNDDVHGSAGTTSNG